MKIKAAELNGAALDWAVAKCEGKEKNWGKSSLKPYKMHCGLKYSRDWKDGGPIIDREGINLTTGMTKFDWWAVQDSGAGFKANGPTPLIAAMRCYVASKLGDEVDIPEELMQMRTFKILDASGVAYNRIKDGMVLEFIRDLPELGQVRLKQPPPLKGTVGMDYAHVEEVKP